MAHQSSIVFLIDVNGIPNLEGKDGGVKGGDDTLGLFPFQKEEELVDPLPSSTSPPGGDVLTWLKEFILVTLFKEANTGRDYDFSRVQWSFKFFNSSHHVEYRDGRCFLPFDNDSFLQFESTLTEKMKQAAPTSGGDAFSNYDNSRARFLSDAIKIITGSLPWSEAPSTSNPSKNFGGDDPPPLAKNTVYAFFRVPRTDQQLHQFSDLSSSNAGTKDFMGVLLPSAFSNRFHHKLRIQLNFVDMWGAPENANHFYVPDWNGSYPRQIIKCLQYLGNGKVLGVPLQQFTNLCSGSLQLGLVPYLTFLRSRLEVPSQNENLPSHIQKLAPGGKLKVPVKISPEFDNDSLNRSLKSGGSFLEASFQSKVLRPFRGGGGGGYEEESGGDEYFPPRGYHHQRLSMPLMRGDGGDRKRKRYEYDMEDYYDPPPPQRHYHPPGGGRRRYVEEMEEAEVDSLCEREQRLENWINDGVFTKRKKSLEGIPPPPGGVPSKPVQRPGALSKSFHVFHEPAPKAASSTGARAKKMLVTVERSKYRSAREIENQRRRTSGGNPSIGGMEVMLDMKRITQKQEKELSAIKRRLKTFLEGELEEMEDPLEWMEAFKSELGKFSNTILHEEEPCLVALAQALVNYALVKFTPQKVASIRKGVGGGRHSKKDLLEELLLIQMTTLNKKIITAHEIPSKDNPRGGDQGLQRILTFRETELQIILRLEIAWCFIEPDEEAMEELLQDIVKLLQIIAAYRTNPPIQNFVNGVLLPAYSQSSRFMRGLYKKMGMPLPTQLAIDGSPLAGGSRRDDDSSMISSTSSANLYPEDSASQLHLHHHKRPRHSPSVGGRKTVIPSKRGGGNSASKKGKRQIMVATTSNPKMTVSQQFMMEGKKGGNKISPKRVRRNLFDVQKKDKKDSKILLQLASSSGPSHRGTKSPSSFKSPKGTSPSGFFRAARSRRQTVANSQPQFGSPAQNNNQVLCPESPATPGGALSGTSKYAATSTSTGSLEKQRVIQESPEVQKNDFDNRPMGRVASVSFYSSNQPRSRAWEKSETQLMAARIKDSVDLRSSELTLDSFENLPQSPPLQISLQKSLSRSHISASTGDTPRTNLSFCNDSYVERNPGASPVATSNHLIPHLTGPAPDLTNPNISALITSTNPIHSLFKEDLPLTVTQTDPTSTSSPPPGGNRESPSTTSNFQTPSKRVQFNLNENLVNTPARRSSTGTPKSILKETHDATTASTTTN